ncbi:MAG: EXORDIUM family protein [Chlamydiales bacterium]|nr:EXORDIUM family protein [Chlamydiales bacterium]
MQSGRGTGTNGNAGADAMASVIAHELAEIMTDPYFTGWYDGRGEENADKCAWTYGTTYKAPNGSNANVKLGNRNYLIQQNWVNSSPSGRCSMHYP